MTPKYFFGKSIKLGDVHDLYTLWIRAEIKFKVLFLKGGLNFDGNYGETFTASITDGR